MEQPLPALELQIFGFAISILALLAESHSQNDVNIPATPSLVSRTLPPLPHLSTSPSIHRFRPPPPPRRGNKVNVGPNLKLSPPPSPHLPVSPSPPFHHLRSPPPQDRRRRKANIGSNRGKKIGLLFVGIAAILQIGVVGFLAFKRRQLLKLKDSYETGS